MTANFEIHSSQGFLSSPKSVSDRAPQGRGLTSPPEGSSLHAAAGARPCRQVQSVQKKISGKGLGGRQRQLWR